MVQRGETARCQEFLPSLPWLSGLACTLAGANLPEPPEPIPRWPLGEHFQHGRSPAVQRFYYENRVSHDPLLFASRLPTALAGALLCFLVWRFARARFGASGGIVALLGTAFTPMMLAYSGLATHDVPIALALFAVALALVRAAERRSFASDLGVGALLGVALGTKLSALALVPVVAAFYVLRERRRPGRIVRRLGVVFGSAWLALVLLFLPAPELGFSHPFDDADAASLCGDRATTACGIEVALLRHAPLPGPWLRTVAIAHMHERLGHWTYFDGALAMHPPRGYLPALLAFKFPLPWLLLAIAGTAALLRTSRLRPLEKLALVAPPLLVLAGAASVGVIWARHLLPLVPFGAVAAASLVTVPVPGARSAALGLAIAAAGCGLAVQPDYMSYLSFVAGAHDRSPPWLADSNVDWGQDLAPLAKRLRALGVKDVSLAYFGTADPAFYGVSAGTPYAVHPGWYAVSRTYLAGLFERGDPLRWLRDLKPAGEVGGSIVLYDVDEATVTRVLERERDEMKDALDRLYARGDPNGALTILDDLLAGSPDHYGAQFQRATALERLGRRGEAIEAWTQVRHAAAAIADVSTEATAEAHLRALGRP